MNIGDRVRHSGYVLQGLRDHWNRCGDYTRKTRAKAHLDAKTAERGTLVAFLPADPARGVSPGLEIHWDNGSVSKCLSYLVVPA